MRMETAPVWLSYAEAARRVKSAKRTVQRWHRQGMPMEWAVDDAGGRYRVVELSVLLAWWRQTMQNSPVHFYRMRSTLAAAGEPVPPVPERFKRAKRSATVRGGSQIVSQSPEQSEPQEDAESRSESSTTWESVLSELPTFRGQAEHAALIAAMAHETPACDGIDAFTRDTFTDPDETELLRNICRSCPLLTLCETFARAGRPSGGMWAGMTPNDIRADISAEPRLSARTVA